MEDPKENRKRTQEHPHSSDPLKRRKGDASLNREQPREKKRSQSPIEDHGNHPTKSLKITSSHAPQERELIEIKNKWVSSAYKPSISILLSELNNDLEIFKHVYHEDLNTTLKQIIFFQLRKMSFVIDEIGAKKERIHQEEETAIANIIFQIFINFSKYRLSLKDIAFSFKNVEIIKKKRLKFILPEEINKILRNSVNNFELERENYSTEDGTQRNIGLICQCLRELAPGHIDWLIDAAPLNAFCKEFVRNKQTRPQSISVVLYNSGLLAKNPGIRGQVDATVIQALLEKLRDDPKTLPQEIAMALHGLGPMAESEDV